MTVTRIDLYPQKVYQDHRIRAGQSSLLSSSDTLYVPASPCATSSEGEGVGCTGC